MEAGGTPGTPSGKGPPAQPLPGLSQENLNPRVQRQHSSHESKGAALPSFYRMRESHYLGYLGHIMHIGEEHLGITQDLLWDV